MTQKLETQNDMRQIRKQSNGTSKILVPMLRCLNIFKGLSFPQGEHLNQFGRKQTRHYIIRKNS